LTFSAIFLKFLEYFVHSGTEVLSGIQPWWLSKKWVEKHITLATSAQRITVVPERGGEHCNRLDEIQLLNKRVAQGEWATKRGEHLSGLDFSIPRNGQRHKNLSLERTEHVERQKDSKWSYFNIRFWQEVRGRSFANAVDPGRSTFSLTFIISTAVSITCGTKLRCSIVSVFNKK
jgi:hypothetical protein